MLKADMDKNVEFDYNYKLFEDFVNENGIEDVELAWLVWRNAVDAEREING